MQIFLKSLSRTNQQLVFESDWRMLECGIFAVSWASSISQKQQVIFFSSQDGGVISRVSDGNAYFMLFPWPRFRYYTRRIVFFTFGCWFGVCWVGFSRDCTCVCHLYFDSFVCITLGATRVVVWSILVEIGAKGERGGDRHESYYYSRMVGS